MWSYTLLFGLQIFTFAATVSGERSVTAKLHHPATLTCDWKCPGSLEWSFKFHTIVARCDQTSCRSEERFNVSHDQYLKGNPHLTITAADYSTRGLYTCQCDGKDVCNVRLLIETQVMSREITPGEPIDVYLPLTDLVEVSFTASDAAQPSDLQICTVDNEKTQCSPDYKERASRFNILQIKDGNVSDSGSYTVRDIVNDETLAILKVHMREEKPYPDCKQDRAMPAWGITLIVVLVILLIVAGLVIGYLWKEIQQLRGESADRHQMTENANQHQQHGMIGHTNHSADVEISVHTALSNHQH
ncbi:uncharacterized protein LOC113528266 isoform X6 [Pangasianodon hypophthalmus]|uniref:uncharacterized protein LOC113528266 isoform X6 n=1 Tax=Pangasianodon hypophthalmus TaxID=310915 RepID=UPI002308019A|nr:uncharacterized protein LOC113528266 isoform X6 [Pangasianodon hypophthalmus]